MEALLSISRRDAVDPGRERVIARLLELTHADANITAFAIIAACTLVAFVWWEWQHEEPIVDIRLLKNRNFGTAVFLQFVLGMVLFGTTVLIPQFLQVLLGYTAERAGMVLSPGALVLMLTMPIAGRLVTIKTRRTSRVRIRSYVVSVLPNRGLAFHSTSALPVLKAATACSTAACCSGRRT